MRIPRLSFIITVLLGFALISPATYDQAVAKSSFASSAPDLFREEALSQTLLSTSRLDRLMPVLDRSFERLFGDWSGVGHWPFAVAGHALLSPISYSTRANPTSGGRVVDRQRQKDEAAHADLAIADGQVASLAIQTMKLHNALENADASAGFSIFLDRLTALRLAVDRLFGPGPEADLTAKPGTSRDLGQSIDHKSKEFQEATTKRDERLLDARNAETRLLIERRIRLQLRIADQELRRNHRPIALSALFGAAKSLWRLRREGNWQLGRLYRRTQFRDFFALQGAPQVEEVLKSGAWLEGSYEREEHRQALFDRAKRIWGKRRGLTSYDVIPLFLKSQNELVRKSFTSALEVSLYIDYMEYVQQLIQFRPSVKELRKAYRDARLIRKWAEAGTGEIRQMVAGSLQRLDAWFAQAIHLRGKSQEQESYEQTRKTLRRSIETMLYNMKRRLKTIKEIRQDRFDKVRKFIAPHLEQALPPPPFDPALPRAA